MCGIGGLYSFDGKQPDIQALGALCEAMVHRGPDGGGLRLSQRWPVALGHRRLSIVDLSEAAAQPMGNEDGSVWVVLNGEIYNHSELRAELSGLGHRFRSHHSDTEVVVHGFEQWGRGVLQRLVGMFALAVLDESTGRLLLARDRVGVKPLYFSSPPGAFCFASEIKALLKLPGMQREVEPAALYHYLSFMAAPAPLTLFRDVFKLPAGHWLEVSPSGSLKAERWWDALPGPLPDELAGLPAPAMRAAAVERLRGLVARAVERRLVSDVPLGLFLSGGLDSSTLLALMSRSAGQSVDAFSVGFSDHPELNEVKEAGATAKLFGARHHVVLMDQADMRGYLDELVHTQDEPIADWVCIPLFFVARLAARAGIKVVLVGEGADEQFCGYRHYLDFLRLHRTCWKPFRALLPGWLQHCGALLAGAVGRMNPALLPAVDMVQRAAADREIFWSGATVFWETQKRLLAPGRAAAAPSTAQEALIGCGLLPPGLLQPDSYQAIAAFRTDLELAYPEADQLARMTYYELRLRLPELLLMRLDKICMSVSVEARDPLLDHELVEYTMRLPERLKTPDCVTKSLLKEAVAGLLPREVIARPKRGFGAPMRQWLQGDFGREAEAAILGSPLLKELRFRPEALSWLFRMHGSGKRDYSAHIWTLYNLVQWHNKWING